MSKWEYTAEMHAKTMERVFESIHDIHLIVTRNEGATSEIKEAISNVKTSMHGKHGNEGIIGMVGTLKNQVTLQWVLIFSSFAFTAGVLWFVVASK